MFKNTYFYFNTVSTFCVVLAWGSSRATINNQQSNFYNLGPFINLGEEQYNIFIYKIVSWGNLKLQKLYLRKKN